MAYSLVARENQQRIGAFDLVERVAQRALQIARRAARHQVHDHFGVAGGLEDRAAMFERAAQLAGVGEIAVVRQRQLALVAIDDDGLRVDQRSVAGGGVARVADGGGAGQPREHRGLKDFLHQAHAFFEMQRGAVGGDDAGGFLAAMLQGVESQIGELGGFGMAEDAADTAVIVKVIVVEMSHGCLDARSPRIGAFDGAGSRSRGATRRSRGSPWRHCNVSWNCAARDATDHARRHSILCRKVPARGQVSFPGRETTARAPRSPKSASSAGSSLSSVTCGGSSPFAGESRIRRGRWRCRRR